MPIYATNHVDPKDPDGAVFYTFNVSQYLNSGATVSSASWSSPGLTRASETTTSTTATAKFSGGVDGQDYAVVCTITTSDGETIPLGGVLRVRRADVPRVA